MKGKHRVIVSTKRLKYDFEVGNIIYLKLKNGGSLKNHLYIDRLD